MKNYIYRGQWIFMFYLYAIFSSPSMFPLKGNHAKKYKQHIYKIYKYINTQYTIHNTQYTIQFHIENVKSDPETQFLLDPTSSNLKTRVHISDPAVPALFKLYRDCCNAIHKERNRKFKELLQIFNGVKNHCIMIICWSKCYIGINQYGKW